MNYLIEIPYMRINTKKACFIGSVLNENALPATIVTLRYLWEVTHSIGEESSNTGYNLLPLSLPIAIQYNFAGLNFKDILQAAEAHESSIIYSPFTDGHKSIMSSA